MIQEQNFTGQPSIITIDNLAVSVERKNIIHSVNLQIRPGSVHALVGPNGSGKSSLAYAIMGHLRYQVVQGFLYFLGSDLIEMSIEERACKGLFLAMQNPVEIPGLSVYALLKEAVRARNVEAFSLTNFSSHIEQVADLLHISRAWIHRPLDSGFSGGEKKKLELLQMLILKPVFSILDEIDSGLDIDALAHMAGSIAAFSRENPMASLLIISHQKRFLDYIKPDYVHIMQEGTIVRSDTYSLIDQIELGGYNAS